MDQHTFAVCAYGESPFLKACIKSLIVQTEAGRIIFVTSTPNKYISDIADQYNIPLYVNAKGGIVQDWNFAYQSADTPYVTITHQDDIYFADYRKHLLEVLNNEEEPIIYFTDYVEIRNGKKIISNTLLRVKRAMLWPLRIKKLRYSKFVRRRILSLGSPICCPAVTFVKKNIPGEPFTPGFRSDEDWEAWERLSKLKGGFIYDPRKNVAHRIHKQSETSVVLQDNARVNEDYIMFCKFWPVVIAKRLAKIYSASEKSNSLD